MTGRPLTPTQQAADGVVGIDDLAAEHGHWATCGDSGGVYVCNCGLPWTEGEGCPFVQGIRALAAKVNTATLAAALAAAGVLTDPDTHDRDAASHCPTCTCGCTCGYGGQHDPANTRCDLTAALDGAGADAHGEGA